MPTYENEEITREEFEKTRKRSVCAVCGAWCNIFYDPEKEKRFIACHEYPRSQHEGISREPSRYEREGIAAFNIPARREILKKEHGEKMTQALDKYQGGGQLTKEGAMEVLKLVYPNCPEPEIVRTAILCRDFGLHPLMKEVYLIPFKNRQGGEDFATVIGITANRKIAAAMKGAFSFLDDTPRAASKEEVVKQFGENSDEAKNNLISICKLQGEKLNLATGFGLWPKNSNPYGTDKGNTQRNMANIRAERQALDRLPGGVIPLRDVDVIDADYVEVPDVGKVDTATGAIVEGTAREIPDEEPEQASTPDAVPSEHICEEHGCEFELKTGKYGPFYSHKLEGGGWCKEKKKAPAPAPEAETPPAEEQQEKPEQSPEPTPNTVTDLTETMQLCNWSAMEVGAYCNNEKGWGIREYTDLKPEQIAELLDHIKSNPK